MSQIHLYLNGLPLFHVSALLIADTTTTGQPCDADGYDLPTDIPPTPDEPHVDDNYFPYSSCPKFKLANLLYQKIQMSGKKITELMDIPPFANSQDLYNTIESTEIGGVAWQTFAVEFDGDLSNDNALPPWKRNSYEAQIANKDFAHEIDCSPKQMFSSVGKHQYTDFMSGNWAWEQDIIATDMDMHGSMFRQTTVLVATGNNKYYPLYTSIGNVQNHVWRAHRNTVSLVGFLTIPKSAYSYHLEFHKFRRQLFHSSLSHILQSLKPWMTTPQITLGPYIADYLEQVLLACIVSGWCPKCTAQPSNFDDDSTAIPRSHLHTSTLEETFQNEPTVLWDGYGIITYIMPFTTQFPRANIHKLLSLDLLHQVIKGTLKDHLINWVMEYLELVHGKAHAKEILADIDWCIAAVPTIPGLRCFPEGHGFKQWMGDDSKALMKVYLPAVAGHIPPGMLDEDTLDQINQAVTHFHEEREIFKECRVREDFSLPHQHSITPNGVCSSITKFKYKESIKGPFCCSSHNEPIGEMLLTNQHLDKLAAARVDFTACRMLKGLLLTSGCILTWDSPRLSKYHRRSRRFLEYICHFLYGHFHPNAEICSMDAPLHSCPIITGTVCTKVYHSATSTYYAPSDLLGIGGMHWEILRATLSWKKGPGQYDCVYIETDSKLDSFQGLLVARVNVFFSFTYQDTLYPCALVQWFTTYGDSPCEEMGLWRVEPDFDVRDHRVCSVVHIDTILRSAHLIGVAGPHQLPRTFTYHDSLYAFRLFYVNKYTDHHTHEIVF
ncbi:hypothetical protein EI94DRAFT_1774813 [Lactarius quietus]|nr:hypothetical protein EI94DRAFT_1774813 [Lactarius quietus]